MTFEQIIALTPASRQTVMASATMPDWVKSMIAKHLKTPEIIEVEGMSAGAGTCPSGGQPAVQN